MFFSWPGQKCPSFSYLLAPIVFLSSHQSIIIIFSTLYSFPAELFNQIEPDLAEIILSKRRFRLQINLILHDVKGLVDGLKGQIK